MSMSVAVIKNVSLSNPHPNGWQFAELGLEVVGLEKPIIAKGAVRKTDNYAPGDVVELRYTREFDRYKFGTDIARIPSDIAGSKLALAIEQTAAEKVRQAEEAKKAAIERAAQREKDNLDKARRIAGETIAAAEAEGGVVIEATISAIKSRSGHFIIAKIDSGGFGAIKGETYSCIRLEKGSRVKVTGVRVDDKYGRSLNFSPRQLVLLDKTYCADPVMRAVNRACKSFTKRRLDTLENVIGADWKDRILNDPWIVERDRAEKELLKEYGVNWRKLATADELAVLYNFPELLNHAAFAKWQIETKQGAVAVAKALNSLSPVKLDLLTVNPPIDNASLKRINAPAPIDAFVFVRQRKLSFAQADGANKLEGSIFRDEGLRLIGAAWDALADSEEDGHSALPMGELIERTRVQYNYPVEEITDAIKRARNMQYFETREGVDHSLRTIGAGEFETLAFAENERAEGSILRNVKAKASNGFEANYNYNERLHELQNKAVHMALARGISIITGGPGTGKTKICAEIGESLDNVLAISVAARAVRNLEEKTGISGMTIAAYLHRAMNGETPGPDTLIIEEASMIGSEDMAAILHYSGKAGTQRIVIVGDKDQLPPIDWGSPFADLIEGEAVPVTKLQKIYRTAEGGGIALLAAHIRDGLPLMPYYDDVVFCNVADDDIAERAISEYGYLLRKGLKPSEIGLITPYRKERYPYASNKLNARIRRLLGFDVNRPGVGDLVIGMKNHRKPYAAHTYLNGQRGVVIDANTQGLGILFDGEEEPEYFEPSELEPDDGLPKYVEYGYAATIHKSQGGEYSHVITIVPRNIKFTFGKPALYTAFTRAKQSLTIIGALDIMPDILEDEGKRRITVLKSMLSLPLRNVPRELPIEMPREVAQKGEPLGAGLVPALGDRLAALMARMGGDKSGADDGWDGDRG
jgi:hypothetical protein